MKRFDFIDFFIDFSMSLLALGTAFALFIIDYLLIKTYIF